MDRRSLMQYGRPFICGAECHTPIALAKDAKTAPPRESTPLPRSEYIHTGRRSISLVRGIWRGIHWPWTESPTKRTVRPACLRQKASPSVWSDGSCARRLRSPSQPAPCGSQVCMTAARGGRTAA
jgi:hypothetical protein